MKLEKKAMRYQKTPVPKPTSTLNKKPSLYSKIKALVKEWFD